jgi:hypothetical protein
MTSGPVPIQIPVQSWFRDHSFGGKTVLPAVETMCLLAAEVKAAFPGRDVWNMTDGSFSRFLELPARAAAVEGLIDCRQDENGTIHACLLSRVQFKGMARIIEHGAVTLPAQDDEKAAVISPSFPDDVTTELKAERLYREMVPFGPAYQTLQDTLFLSEREAWGRLKAPEFSFADGAGELGSPFPFDGALHAACVHGQQFVDFIPFPVGFERRVISTPTRPGGEYITKVILVDKGTHELIFDLAIFGHAEQLFETVTGIRMRRVGQGKG